MKIKKALLASTLLAITLGGASCQGPNKLFNGVNEWNADLTETDWINTAVFWTLNIVPVYGFAYLVDITITNTATYWQDRGNEGDDE